MIITYSKNPVIQSSLYNHIQQRHFSVTKNSLSVSSIKKVLAQQTKRAPSVVDPAAKHSNIVNLRNSNDKKDRQKFLRISYTASTCDFFFSQSDNDWDKKGRLFNTSGGICEREVRTFAYLSCRLTIVYKTTKGDNTKKLEFVQQELNTHSSKVEKIDIIFTKEFLKILSGLVKVAIRDLRQHETKFSLNSSKHVSKRVSIAEVFSQNEHFVVHNLLRCFITCGRINSGTLIVPFFAVFTQFLVAIWSLSSNGFQYDQISAFFKSLVFGFQGQVSFVLVVRQEAYFPADAALQSKEAFKQDPHCLVFTEKSVKKNIWFVDFEIPSVVKPTDWVLKDGRIFLEGHISCTYIPHTGRQFKGSVSIAFDFIVEPSFVSIMNKYRSQAYCVNEKVLGALNKEREYLVENELSPFGWAWSGFKAVDAFFDYAESQGFPVRLGVLMYFYQYVGMLNFKFSSAKVGFLILSALRKFPLYFDISLDYRGRDVAYGLHNPINSKLVRYCLNFYNFKLTYISTSGIMYLCAYAEGLVSHTKVTLSYKVIYQKIAGTCNILDFKAFYGQIKYSVKSSNRLAYISMISRTWSQQVVFLDASASGYQMLAMACNSVTVAKITNLQANQSPFDPYIMFVDGFLDVSSISVSRQALKTFFINKLYGQGKLSLILAMQESADISYQEANEIYSLLVPVFETRFQVYFDFLDFLENEYKFSNGRGVSIKFNFFETNYSPVALDNHKFVVPANGGSKGFSFLLQVPNNGFKSVSEVAGRDKGKGLEGKLSRAFKANLIHSMDATVKTYVLEKIQEKGYPVIVIHDSFCTHPNYCCELNQFYNEGLISVSRMFQPLFKKFNNERLEIDSNAKMLVKFSRKDIKQIRNSLYGLNPFLFFFYLL